MVAWSEMDFAGRHRIRRTTSSSVVRFGNHFVKTYSQTQEAIASSSGESKFYGIAKAVTTGLGVKGLMEDLCVGVEVQVNADSSAAKSAIARRGAGRVRRVEVRELSLLAKGELKNLQSKG